MTYDIQDDIAIPANRTAGARLKYPFDQLAIGQSFAVPVADGDYADKAKQRMGGAALAWTKRNGVTDRSFTVRVVDTYEGAEVRVWAVAPRAPRPRKAV